MAGLVRIHVASLSLLALVAACGDASLRDTSADARANAAADQALRIVATDTGFEAPDRVPSGLRHVVYENRGTQIHEAMFIKLPDGMSANQYVEAVRAGSLFPAGALDYSGPGLTSPGDGAELWLTLDPGNYILFCWNDHETDAVPVHSLTVDAARSDDPPPPAADVVVKLVDFRVEFDGELRAGPQVLRVETIGPSMHELDVFRLDEGKTAADLASWYKTRPRGPAPGRAGTGVLDSHDIARVVTLKDDFVPGHYVFWCSMPMSSAPDAPRVDVSHADAGMVREVVIAE